MTDLLSQNKKLIINSDIDGVLSGLLLSNFLNCEIVGFSNSDHTVWIDKSKVLSIYDAVYIDLFVAHPRVCCIDQHIVSVNERHHQLLKNNPRKVNPNFDNPRFHLPNHSYYNKYPFGTIHYLIAMLEAEGVKVDLNWMNPVGSIKFIDYLLRADDAMQTTVDSNYQANAASWWNWLAQKSGNAASIYSLRNYLANLNGVQVRAIKQTTTATLTHPSLFACSSPDGGYKSIADPSGKLLPKVIQYIQFLAKSSGLTCFDLNLTLSPQVGRVNRLSLTPNQMEELIHQNSFNEESIFSYAFVRSANRGENFSYTIMEP